MEMALFTPTEFPSSSIQRNLSVPRSSYASAPEEDVLPMASFSEGEVRKEFELTTQVEESVSPLNPSRRTTSSGRKRLDASFRNDSLSSDQSECVQHTRPPPPKPHKRRIAGPGTSGSQVSTPSSFKDSLVPKVRGGSSLLGATSSDEEGARSEYTSAAEDDVDIESESHSDRGTYT